MQPTLRHHSQTVQVPQNKHTGCTSTSLAGGKNVLLTGAEILRLNTRKKLCMCMVTMKRMGEEKAVYVNLMCNLGHLLSKRFR